MRVVLYITAIMMFCPYILGCKDNNTQYSTTQTENNIEQKSTPPIFRGNVREWINKNLIFPKEYFTNDNIADTTTIKVPIYICEDGRVISAPSFNAQPPFKEEIERLLKIMPLWTPGTVKGKPTRYTYSLTFRFIRPRRYQKALTDSITAFSSHEEKVSDYWKSDEICPHFKSGDINEWINENIIYTPEMAEKKLKGTVYIKFIVSKDGTINNIKLSRKVHPLLDAEAIRLIKAMPIWDPAYDQGVPVERPYILGILFSGQK